MKKILCLALSILTLMLLLTSCGDSALPDGYKETDESTNYVLIEVEGYGQIVVELYPDVAPKTVENFKGLVSEKFYDGLIFHRVIEDFMIQGGDPDGKRTGGSDENVEGEFALNGYNNTLKHEKGVISMARSGSQYEQYLSYYTIEQLSAEYKKLGYDISAADINSDIKKACNSASSQFFIVHKDSSHLDGNYAAFGKVVYGLDVVDKIAVVDTDSSDKPKADVVMTSVRFVDVK